MQLSLRAIPKYEPPGAYNRRGLLQEAFCGPNLGGGGGLIFEGAYFRNFALCKVRDLLALCLLYFIDIVKVLSQSGFAVGF